LSVIQNPNEAAIMSDQKPESLLKNPQIIAALIGGIITLIVAIVGILPALLNNKEPKPQVVIIASPVPTTATAIPIVATLDELGVTAFENMPTATTVPVTDVPNPTETTIPPTNTAEPSSTPIPAQPTAVPNVLLMYDDVSFTLLNQAGSTISLEGIIFRSNGGQWEARKWGPSVYNSLPADKCLRLRDSTVGNRQPPAPCRNQIYGLIEVGNSAFFWIGVDSFDVVYNDLVIATCKVSDQNCAIAVP
jgi:hypothetical protein